jgi:putative ABC transport system substrate-binding protein
MRRRDFVKGLVGSTAAWPLGAYAQQSKTPVVGFLHSGLAERTTQDGFKKGLAESGFDDGRNVSVQFRFAEGRYDRLSALAAELVNYPVAVLFAGGGVHTALATKSVTSTTPIVFANGSDPVQFGLVGSLNNPGGNITGVSFFAATLEEKRLGLLSELVPTARVFGIMINPANDNAENQLKDVAQGTIALHRPAVTLKASNDGEIEAAFAAFAEQNVNAVLVASDPFFNGRRDKITELAARPGWRACELRQQSVGQLPPGRRLCRSCPEGRKAGQHSRCSGNQVRICHQPENRQVTRPHASVRRSLNRRCRH